MELGPVSPISSSSQLIQVKFRANICPLFKKGETLLPAITALFLTCIPCKLLEHIVWSISNIIDEHELLSDWQNAFRKWHSCETHLTMVINDWAKI